MGIRVSGNGTNLRRKLPGLPQEACDRIARGEKEGMVARSFLEVGDELRERYSDRRQAVLRILPVVVILVVGVIVLCLALEILGKILP